MLCSYGGNRSFTSRSDFFGRGLAARPRLGDGVSDDAELEQRAEVVPARPVLDGLAVLQAVDVDLIHLDLPALPGKVASASRAVPASAARSSLAETIAAPTAAILPARCVFLSAVFIVCLVPFCMRSGTRCPDPRLPRGSFRPGISGPGLHLDETRGPVSGVDGTVAEEPRDG